MIRNHSSLRGAISIALDQAHEWLCSIQEQNGSWRDFWLPPGTSDEWVTGYVGAALASSKNSAARSAAADGWRFLTERQRATGGWGYAAGWPPDADSTAWALALAERLSDGNSASARIGARALHGFVVAGGIATYGQKEEIAARIDVAECSVAGWIQPHLCVTGAVACLPGFTERLFVPIINAQGADGSWSSYWWQERAYATVRCVDALAGLENGVDLPAVAAATEWAKERVVNGSYEPFALALLLSILKHSPDAASARERCVKSILSDQKEDGMWRGTAYLRVPRPDVVDPDSIEAWSRWWGSGSAFNVYSIDQRSVFTTATVVSALQSLDEMLEP